MIEQALARLLQVVDRENLLISTAPHLVEPIAATVPDFPRQAIIAEPHKRNTAGCLVWIAASLLARSPDAAETLTLLVVASDHVIEPASAFAEALRAAASIAEDDGALVIFGIPPTRPETGYGYIESSPEEPSLVGSVRARGVRRFHEKPDLPTAVCYLESGRFYWNSGMFVWTLKVFLEELAKCSPVHHRAILALADAMRSGRDEEASRMFAELPDEPIDRALLERSKNVVMIEAPFRWDDVGSWDALARIRESDERGNVQLGGTLLHDVENCIAISQLSDVPVCLLGVRDLIVVATENGIFVCDKQRAQDVREIVNRLDERFR